jgi:hypothetical protein
VSTDVNCKSLFSLLPNQSESHTSYPRRQSPPTPKPWRMVVVVGGVGSIDTLDITNGGGAVSSGVDIPQTDSWLPTEALVLPVAQAHQKMPNVGRAITAALEATVK